jgi:hypothetical protein
MISKINGLHFSWMALASFILCGTAPLVSADEPCESLPQIGDPLGECRVLIEINATDGDIGFHALFDGEGWNLAEIFDDNGDLIFSETVMDGADAALATQGLTENFFESTEPLCEEDIEEGEPFRTLEDFLLLFPEGDYDFSLDSGAQTGTTNLTHVIPAAPADVDFDGKDITWEYGDDLGECTTWPMGFAPAEEDAIIGYEVVLEPEDDELGAFSFSIRVPPDVNKIRVPKQYLAALEADTPLKVEVGAIEDRDGFFGNQTFSEEDGFCNNPSQQQCPEEDDDDE